MVSLSHITQNRRRLRLNNAGRKRKNKNARKSTQSFQELFAGCGECGEAVSVEQSQKPHSKES